MFRHSRARCCYIKAFQHNDRQLQRRVRCSGGQDHLSLFLPYSSTEKSIWVRVFHILKNVQNVVAYVYVVFYHGMFSTVTLTSIYFVSHKMQFVFQHCIHGHVSALRLVTCRATC